VQARELGEIADGVAVDQVGEFGFIFTSIYGGVSCAIEQQRGAVKLEKAGDLGGI
jgi:hypothetical protein